MNISKDFMASWALCGHATAEAYINGRWAPPGLNMEVGTIFHAIAAARSIDSNITAETALLDAGRRFGNLQFRTFYPEPTAQDIAEARKNLLTYVSEVFLHPEIWEFPTLATEVKAEFEWGIILGKPAMIKGIFDRVVDTGRVLQIRDWKTSGKKPNIAELNADDEMTMYFYLTSQYYGSIADYKMTPELWYDYFIVRKSGCEYLPIRVHRDKGDVRIMHRRIAGIIQQIESGIYPPATAGCWKCSPKYCHLWMADCPYISDRLRSEYLDAAMAAKERTSENQGFDQP